MVDAVALRGRRLLQIPLAASGKPGPAVEAAPVDMVVAAAVEVAAEDMDAAVVAAWARFERVVAQVFDWDLGLSNIATPCRQVAARRGVDWLVDVVELVRLCTMAVAGDRVALRNDVAAVVNLVEARLVRSC